MLNRLQYLLCRIAGFEPFDVQKHGIIAPANWHGAPAPARQKERTQSEFEVVATTSDAVALSTKLRPAPGDTMTFEAPVRSGNSADTSGRVPVLTHADLRELGKRNVSQRAAEKIKPLWCEGKTAAQIASALKVSLSTSEKAIAAFNTASLQVPANAISKH